MLEIKIYFAIRNPTERMDREGQVFILCGLFVYFYMLCLSTFEVTKSIIAFPLRRNHATTYLSESKSQAERNHNVFE